MRTKLLRSGLGFFAFAVGISLVNVLAFPYARENYGYGLIGLAVTMSSFFVVNFLAQLFLLEREVSRRLAGPDAAAPPPGER